MRVGLAHRLDYAAKKLSGGQKPRVAVARAVMDLLHESCAAEGTAFLISTHDPEIAARCDRIVKRNSMAGPKG